MPKPSKDKSVESKPKVASTRTAKSLPSKADPPKPAKAKDKNVAKTDTKISAKKPAAKTEAKKKPAGKKAINPKGNRAAEPESVIEESAAEEAAITEYSETIIEIESETIEILDTTVFADGPGIEAGEPVDGEAGEPADDANDGAAANATITPGATGFVPGAAPEGGYARRKKPVKPVLPKGTQEILIARAKYTVVDFSDAIEVSRPRKRDPKNPRTYRFSLKGCEAARKHLAGRRVTLADAANLLKMVKVGELDGDRKSVV